MSHGERTAPRQRRTVVVIVALLALGTLPTPLVAAGGQLAFAGRAEDGVALRLRVVPDPASGVSGPKIASVAVRAIAGRARDAGFSVLSRPHRDGTLDLWVPVARTSAELSELLEPAGVAIYDLDRALANGPLPDPLLRLAGRLGPSRGGVLYLTVPGMRSLNGPEHTRTALLGTLGGTEASGKPLLSGFPRGVRVRHLPRRFRLVSDAAGKKFSLLRSSPTLRSADLSVPVRRRSTLTFTLTPEGRARWAHLRATGGRPALVVYAWRGMRYIAGEADTAAGQGRRLVVDAQDGGRARLIGDMLRNVLPGRVIVEAESETGAPRVRAGEAIRPLPDSLREWLQQSGFGVQGINPDTVLRALTLTTRAGEWSIWTGLDAGGWASEVLVDPRPGLGSIAPNRGGGLGCQLTPARPILRICGANPGYVMGRVSSRVSRVTGGTATTIQNGWFLTTGVRITDSVPPNWRLAALDSQGRVIARSTGPD